MYGFLAIDEDEVGHLLEGPREIAETIYNLSQEPLEINTRSRNTLAFLSLLTGNPGLLRGAAHHTSLY